MSKQDSEQQYVIIVDDEFLDFYDLPSYTTAEKVDWIHPLSTEALSIINAVLSENYLEAWRLLMELPQDVKEASVEKHKPLDPYAKFWGKSKEGV